MGVGSGVDVGVEKKEKEEVGTKANLMRISLEYCRSDLRILLTHSESSGPDLGLRLQAYQLKL